MITFDTVNTVWLTTPSGVSKSTVKAILEQYEKIMAAEVTQPVKSDPPQVLPDQSVIVFNSDEGSWEEYATLENAAKVIENKAIDNDWDQYDIETNFRVIIGRELSIGSKKTFKVNLS